MSAPVAYSHVPTPPQKSLKCKVGIHIYKSVYKLEERNDSGELVILTISQACERCLNVRVKTYRVQHPQFYPLHGFFRYA